MKHSSAPSQAARTRQWLERVDSTLRSYGVPQAARLALQAIEAGVEHPSLLNLAASARHGESRFEEAVDVLKRARSLAPKDANVLNSLGICLKALGRPEAALEAYAAALKIDPGLAGAHFNRGALLESLNNVTAARSAYERAAGLDSNYVEPLAGLAWLDAQAGDPVSARARAQRALVLSKLPGAHDVFLHGRCRAVCVMPQEPLVDRDVPEMALPEVFLVGWRVIPATRPGMRVCRADDRPAQPVPRAAHDDVVIPGVRLVVLLRIGELGLQLLK